MFAVEVDWDDTGTFSGPGASPDASIIDDVLALKWRLGMRKPYQEIADESVCTVTVRNTDGKYNPENPASPLYGRLLPHRKIQVRAGKTVLWRGWLSFPQVAWQTGPRTGATTAVLEAVGPKSRLESLTVTLPLYQDVTGDVILADVIPAGEIAPVALDAWKLGVPGAGELGVNTTLASVDSLADLEPGVTVLGYYGDAQAADAYAVVQAITQAERGRFFFNRAGKAVWWNRHHQLLDTTVDATVNTASGAYQPAELDYVYGADLANVIRVEVQPRRTESETTLWQLDAAVTVPVGRSVQFMARLRKAEGAFAAAESLEATPTFSAGTGAVTVTPQGGYALVTVENTGDETAVLSDLVLAGAPVRTQHRLAVEVEDAASIALYGRHGLTIKLGPVADYATAEATAHFERVRRSAVLGCVRTLTYHRAADGLANAFALDWTIGTRLRIVADELGHTAEYFIMGEEHAWRPGRSHTVTYHLEPAVAHAFWILGQPGFSELGQATRLGY